MGDRPLRSPALARTRRAAPEQREESTMEWRSTQRTRLGLCFVRAVVRWGLPALLGVALSAAGAQAAPFAYVLNDSVDGAVSVIDTATNTVTATVPEVGGRPGVAVTPDGTRVYVANGPSSVSVIDTATNTVTATVGVGDGPFGVAVTPDGARVYVPNWVSGDVSVIDTATNTVTTTVPVGPRAMAFGQFIGPLPAVVTIAAVIALFDQAVADGTLVGQGPGNSAPGRLKALGNKLRAASDLLARGDIAAACGRLQDVANRTDDAFPPPDFVQGPAAPDLLDAVTALREQLGCVD
jgi:YVTN family beta-propeller protein